ncbi:MAG: hypothetical protein QOH59_807 [Gemmatimonadales bacterium]|jgi:hypothetical protein|nr:hypothetical protein [Gemmatimonadales bacterium]
MRPGTAVSILIPNRFGTDPDFIRVPGIVMAPPIPNSYVNRNGATVASATVDVISLRDTRGQNPAGGRVWYQATQEPTNLLLRRFGDPVAELDGLTAQQPWEHVAVSVEDFRRRQQAARANHVPVAAA